MQSHPQLHETLSQKKGKGEEEGEKGKRRERGGRAVGEEGRDGGGTFLFTIRFSISQTKVKTAPPCPSHPDHLQLKIHSPVTVPVTMTGNVDSYRMQTQTRSILTGSSA